jgi:enoyl-CoA hydratase
MKWEKQSDHGDVIYERSGYCARITLNRPEHMNTGFKLFDDMYKAMVEAEKADDVKVIVFKGAGRCLSTGAPLNEVGFVYGWKEPKPGEKRPSPNMRNRLNFDRFTFLETWQHMLLSPKITIVQAHGYLLGASMDLFLNADLLFAADDCKLGEIENRLGIAGLTMSPIMISRIGLTRALDLCITGRMIDGKEAARIGLVNYSAPADQLEERVNNLAEGISQYPRDGISLSKASRHVLYDIMGITKGFAHGYTMHTLQTARARELVVVARLRGSSPES